MNVLEVKNVYKHLGKRQIIRGISFSVKEGEIFGFLGPNGAGKTTTIRMLVGLIATDKGTISIMGNDIRTQREKALKEVGAVVENPELYTYLSGIENLMQVAAIRKVNRKKVDEIVELVGLKSRINDKVKKYSLGMKQRLGLGIALLSRPKLLILDEPTNGLDPSGIMDFRNIVKSYAKEYGTSVFISSHILSEIQQLCDTVAFINDGQIQSVESLNPENKEEKVSMVIVSNDTEKCGNVLSSIPYISNIELKEGKFSIKIDENNIPELIYKLSDSKVPVREIFEKHQELEERYVELVEGGNRK